MRGQISIIVITITVLIITSLLLYTGNELYSKSNDVINQHKAILYGNTIYPNKYEDISSVIEYVCKMKKRVRIFISKNITWNGSIMIVYDKKSNTKLMPSFTCNVRNFSVKPGVITIEFYNESVIVHD